MVFILSCVLSCKSFSLPSCHSPNAGKGYINVEKIKRKKGTEKKKKRKKKLLLYICYIQILTLISASESIVIFPVYITIATVQSIVIISIL